MPVNGTGPTLRAMQTMRFEQAGGVGWIVFDRPPLNGMIPLMVLEMYELLARLAIDPDVRVLVLTGSGGPGNGFLPGADLQHMLSAQRDVDVATVEQDPRYAEAYRVPAMLHAMPQVTIAAVNGGTAGAGLGWALGCDFRVAAASARFNTAFLALDVAGDMGVPWSLSRVVGAGRARELCFFPGKVDAAEALRIGLVTRVFDDASFEAEVRAMAASLADRDAVALRTLKANFVSAETASYTQYLDVETARHLPLVERSRSAGGFASFFERGPRG